MILGTLSTPKGTVAIAHLGSYAAPISDGDGSIYADVGALLRDPDGLTHARNAACNAPVSSFDHKDLARPILEPSAVVCVGLNYAGHVNEMRRERPKRPTFFAKLARALTDPYADVIIPTASEAVDYEGEVAIVIGRRGRNIAQSDALGYVAGLTLMNDVSMRDFQRATVQWFAGKNWFRSTPLGPFVASLDEFDDESPELRVFVNGSERQRAPISDLIFDFAELVAELSRIVPLEPGDIIATGTPSGVGETLDPPTFLQHGDVVEVALPGLGALRNRFIAP